MNRSLLFAALTLFMTPVCGLPADDPTADTELGQPILLAPLLEAPAAENEADPSAPGSEPTPTPAPEAVAPDAIPHSTRKIVPPMPTPASPYLPDDPSDGTIPPPEPLVLPPAILPPRPIPSPPVALYPRVRVRHSHKAHPQGISTVIPVNDPRRRAGVVYVEVCLPPCPCLSVRQNLIGTRTSYDFGAYRINIITRLGVVIVDYDC